MRTTIILDDILFGRIKPLISKRGLSEWINRRIREFLDRDEKRKRMVKLEKAYARAALKTGRKSESGFDATDMEDWPEW